GQLRAPASLARRDLGGARRPDSAGAGPSSADGTGRAISAGTGRGRLGPVSRASVHFGGVCLGHSPPKSHTRLTPATARPAGRVRWGHGATICGRGATGCGPQDGRPQGRPRGGRPRPTG